MSVLLDLFLNRMPTICYLYRVWKREVIDKLLMLLRYHQLMVTVNDDILPMVTVQFYVFTFPWHIVLQLKQYLTDFIHNQPIYIPVAAHKNVHSPQSIGTRIIFKGETLSWCHPAWFIKMLVAAVNKHGNWHTFICVISKCQLRARDGFIYYNIISNI